jgi:hypothetical protein
MQPFQFPWRQILAAGVIVFISFTTLRLFGVEINALIGIAVIAVAAIVAQKVIPRVSRD